MLTKTQLTWVTNLLECAKYTKQEIGLSEDERKGIFNFSVDYILTTLEKATKKEKFKLFGVYSSDDELLSVHETEWGASDNCKKYEKNHLDNSFYVDYVVLND